jgi:hypothetical protein
MTAPSDAALVPSAAVLIAPEPAFTVRVLPEPVTPALKVTALLVVLSAVLAAKVTAPVYVWMPVVVMLLASADVPVTTKLDVPAVLVMLLPDAMLKLATV